MISLFLVIGEMRVEIIWKKEKFQHREHDEEFNEDNPPQLAADHHGTKTVPVKKKDSCHQRVHLFKVVNINIYYR